MKRTILILAALLVALSYAATAARAAGGVEFRNSYTVPFAETDVSCTGESVDITGLLQHRVVIVVDDTGGVHVTTITRATAKGVSATGTRYVGNFTDGGSEYFAPGEIPANGTFLGSFRLISIDGSANILARWKFHITVNAKGEVVSFGDEIEIVCV